MSHASRSNPVSISTLTQAPCSSKSADPAHAYAPESSTDSRLRVRRTIGANGNHPGTHHHTSAAYEARPRTKSLAFKCPPAMMEMEHARAVFRIATCMRRDMHPFGRRIMVRTELRVVLAAIATFIMLGGIAVAIHGLLFDLTDAVRYGRPRSRWAPRRLPSPSTSGRTTLTDAGFRNGAGCRADLMKGASERRTPEKFVSCAKPSKVEINRHALSAPIPRAVPPPAAAYISSGR